MSNRSSQSGIAIGWILLVVALLGVITAGLALSSRSSSKSTESGSALAELHASAATIRARIAQCLIDNPEGNNGCADDTCVKQLPASDVALDEIVCPGRDEPLFSGSEGIYMPKQSHGFNQWEYTNDNTGAYILVEQDGLADWKNTVMNRVAERFGSAEAESSPTEGTLKIWIKKR